MSMSIMQLRSTHSVTFSDVTPPDSEASCIGSSSPAPANIMIPSTSSGSIPLGPAKTVSINRRAVIFSPRNDTKYFNSTESISASCKPLPPPSIRSYLGSDDSRPEDSPSASRSSPRPLSETPAIFRSILKQRVHEIRLAASAEEGTLNNKEAARLLVSGTRPKLMARDSFQLAMMRKAGGDEGKGKTPQLEDAPGSDDSTSSEENEDREAVAEGSSEDEEEAEMDGALGTGSLVSIILDGAEDLLTLEEAYNTLTYRLRQRIPTDPTAELSEDHRGDIRIATKALRDEAPAMVRAMQRDLQRLMGKVPNPEVGSSEAEGSPFRTLAPLHDSTPINGQSCFTVSPSPNAVFRQGYTESEVRYRRESSGVGAAALRFLAFTFHAPHLFTCFSEADLQALLEQVMIIPRTPRLPTPNPKRTYYLSILIISQMKVPGVCVQPIKDKIVRAVETAINDSLASSTMGAKEGPSQIRKEGFQAATNLVSSYPTIFFQHYSDLLPGCLRALSSPQSLFRNKASAAVAAFAAAKFSILADLQDRLPEQREAWIRTKAMAQKSEFFVISHLKGALRSPGKSSTIYGHNGEKKTECTALEQIFKDTVGSATDVHWACATWAVIVSLMGSGYSSSGLASSFDHIMDRSLQPSTNVVRPLLARAAWNHAIHAYLRCGSATSLSHDGRLVQSFKPFLASPHQDVLERLATILTPVNLALGVATDPKAVTKVLIPAGEYDGLRHTWERLEKTKKLQWMITCGLGAASIVYAYTGMALHHEDQSAKEMSTLTGLPSSDGALVPESSLQDSRLDRLDKTWEKVVEPMLRSFGSICGIDRLKSHGWAMLDAITSQRDAAWTLDRLLCPRYLSGEVFGIDKETDLNALLDDLLAASIRPSDIPAWGSAWIVRRFEQLLDLFEESLSGVNGINDLSSFKWIRDEQGNTTIPLVLSRIWSNLLRVLSSIKQTDTSSAYTDGLQLVCRHIIQIFNRDPAAYVPISLFDAEGHCTIDGDTIRISLTSHLVDAAIAILGRDAIGGIRLPVSNQDEREDEIPAADTVIAHMAFGTDSNAQATVAGSLLGQLLRTQVLSFPLQESARTGFKRLIGKILDAGSIQGFSGRLLGDLTNHMPWISAEQEEIQLDVWRLLALKWTEMIDLQPSATAATTNHTGALLVSLLSCPFRGRQITSVWHQHADHQDLAVWQALLKATVLRFRVKRVGSNLGVLESLAGHLGDFLESGEKTSSTTITLSCLASATSWIAFGPIELHHAAHFNINENFVPVDFLALVSTALLESYPQSESLAYSENGVTISSAVGDLLDSLRRDFEKLPLEFAGQVLAPVKAGLVVWLADELRLANDAFGARLDNLYVTLLGVFAAAIEADHIPACSETLDDLIDIYGPRLSRAQSSSVPIAFKDFWHRAFQHVHLDYSEDVAGFLRDVMEAVPGMIVAPGLAVQDSWSEEESLARYPHSQNLAVRAAPTATREEPELALPVDELIDTTALDMDTTAVALTDPTGEYDADISQSIEDPPPASHPAVHPSPNPSQTESERKVSEEASLPTNSVEDDVFGPAAIAQPRQIRKRARKSRPLSDAQTLPEAKRSKPDTSSASASLPSNKALLAADSDDDLNDCIEVRQTPPTSDCRRSGRGKPRSLVIEPQPINKPSILASASRWLSRVPSFGGLFSPVRPHGEEDTTTTDQSDRSARKARRASLRAKAQGPVSETDPGSSSAGGRKRLIPIVDLTESHHLRKRRRTSEVEAVVSDVEEDEEDELLLCPESARRRRREEEGAIAEAAVLRASTASPHLPRVESQDPEETQASVGRFEDAPEDSGVAVAPEHASPGPSVGNPSPSRRSAEQTRVLAMIEQAAQARAAIESLDLEGVLALLRNVDDLRTAATANLQTKAEDARRAKRAQRE